MELQHILYKLQRAEHGIDFLNIWNEYKDFLEENDGEIIFTQNHFENPSLPSIKIFHGNEKNFKSLFINNNFTFLNRKVYNEMSLGKRANFVIDYTVSFDTQFVSLIERYFTYKNFSNEKDFEELLYKLKEYL